MAWTKHRHKTVLFPGGGGIRKGTFDCCFMGEKFDGVIEHAATTRNTQSKMQADGKFGRAFHRRPNSRDLPIVSTLPFAPMRGKTCKDDKELECTLKDPSSALMTICADDKDKAKSTLAKFGFKPRVKGETEDGAPKTGLEENVQAKYTHGMIGGEPEYQEIRFIASAFIAQYADELRADVIGYCPGQDTLCVFEPKKTTIQRQLLKLKIYRHYA